MLGSTKPFVVDTILFKRIRRRRWRYVTSAQTARSYFKKSATRKLLHHYVYYLGHKKYPVELRFKNGNPFDCRLSNLEKLDRSDGVAKKAYSNNTSGYRGVSYKATTDRYAALIRIKGKLKHLGYFATAKEAGQAYIDAWNTAHPNKTTRTR